MEATPKIPVEAWEWLWAPYDAATYKLVLDQISIDDVVLEIGAGDLRLSRQMAARARRVYALEINEPLLNRSRRALPRNLNVIAADARIEPFPEDITTAVLLMRHCTHFALFFNKLQEAGCERLITNARWGMSVEIIDLNGPRQAYQAVPFGWYACRCGGRGFKPGPSQALTEAALDHVWELTSCPTCAAIAGHNSKPFSPT